MPSRTNHSVDTHIDTIEPATPSRPRLWLHVVIVFGLCLFVPLLLGGLINGKSIAEKVATTSVQPLFIAILSILTLASIGWSDRRYWLAITSGVIGAGLWIISTDALGGLVVQSWERQVRAIAWDDLEPMDYVVVLGGGTGKRPDNAPQLMPSGDRVATAARLYHRGLAKSLITTGDVLVINAPQGDSTEQSDLPTVQTLTLWKELGVPEDIVFSLGGQNTSSEMRELSQHPEWWQGRRCGVITSAFHMPRAMRLAKNQGIDLIPIPCNFFCRPPVWTMDSFMPKPQTLMEVTQCIKEWIGMAIGR